MRFAVLGAGAVGAYVGAALGRGGAEVTLIARGENLRALQENGVRVFSPRGDFAQRLPATDDWAAIEDVDVLILALKAYALPEVASELGKRLRPGAAVVAAQNGIPWWYFESHGGPFDGVVLETVDPGGVISRSLPSGCAVGCVVYCSTELISPGVVRHIEGTRFSLGEPDRTLSDRCLAIAEAFRNGGLKAPVERDLRNEIWLKLLGNAIFNPISALTGATLAQLGATALMRVTLLETFKEIAAVAAALDVRMPVSLERRLEGGFGVGEHKTSMLQDHEHGKPLEYQCMSGAILELSAKLDLPVPRLEMIHACIEVLDTFQPAGRSLQA